MKFPYEKTLPNGRKYKICLDDPASEGDVILGCGEDRGFRILAWEQRLNKGKGMWTYVSTAPDQECLENFFKAMSR